MRETTTYAKNLIYPDAPVHILDAINRYVEHRHRPGGFVTAVLSNNLIGAFNTADKESRHGLGDILKYIYWEIPAESWGSLSKVEAWLGSDKVHDPNLVRPEGEKDQG